MKGNKNVKGISGRTTRSLRKQPRVFCLTFCLKTRAAFFPLISALFGDNLSILMIKLSPPPVLAYLLRVLQVTMCGLSCLFYRASIYIFCKSVCGPGLRRPNTKLFQSPLMSTGTFPFMFVYFRPDLISSKQENLPADKILSK